MPNPNPETGHSAPIGFIKIPGVKGESHAKDHDGEIAILSMELGAEHTPGAASAATRTKVATSDITFEAVTNSASPQLFRKSVYGEKLDTVVLTLSETNGKEVWNYLTITLTDAMISSYRTTVKNGTSEPIDEVTLSFRKIEFEVVASTEDHKPGSTTVTKTDLGTHSK